MQCNCGASMREWSYQTVDGKTHEVRQCPSCGRRHTKVYDQQRKLLESKG